MQRAHPDFQQWSSTSSEPASPVTMEELLRRNPEEEIEYFLNYRGDNVAEAAARSFEWSWQLVQGLRSNAAWSSEHWESILRGWQKNSLTEEYWTSVLTLLRECSELYTFAHPIAGFLLAGIVKEYGSIPFASLSQAQCVAQALWNVHPGEPSKDRPQGWAGEAINRPGGILVQFWLRSLSKQCTEAGDSWTGIPDDSKRFFQKVLTEPTPSAQLGRVILASQLYFLFTLEADWTRENILPLLDWSLDTRRAEQTWDGFLTWGRPYETLLSHLIPLYERTYAHTAQLGRLRDQFSSHLANISLFSSHHPLHGTWFDNFLLTAAPEDRKNWASHVGHRLRSLPEDVRENLWERWMKRYWDRRIRGIPIPLDHGELEEMVEWSLHLGSLFPQAVERICCSSAPPLEHGLIYYQLAEMNYTTTYPDALVQLLGHLLPATQRPFDERDYVERLVRDLVELPAQIQDLEQLCNELARLGSPHAAEIRGRLRNRQRSGRTEENSQTLGDGEQPNQ
jgi:Domain of unknown function (DUF4020)